MGDFGECQRQPLGRLGAMTSHPFRRRTHVRGEGVRRTALTSIAFERGCPQVGIGNFKAQLLIKQCFWFGSNSCLCSIWVICLIDLGRCMKILTKTTKHLHVMSFLALVSAQRLDLASELLTN